MAPKFVNRVRAGIWPPRYLRYLLIWPLVTAYRRKSRTHLSWRLAGSHFATVLASVIAICIVGIVVAVIGSRIVEMDRAARRGKRRRSPPTVSGATARARGTHGTFPDASQP